MALRQIILLIITAFYFWFCHWFICNKVHTSCYGCEDNAATAIAPVQAEEEKRNQNIAPAKPTKPPVKQQDPLTFNWESDRPVTSSRFPQFQTNILQKRTKDNILVITGNYFADEKTPANYDNMGLARADKIKELFLEDVPEARIQTRSKLVGERAGVRDDLFRSAVFNWIEPIPEAYGDNKDVARVEELEDSALIYFPFNSAQKEVDAKVDKYLTKLVKDAKASGSRIELTGHTDDMGKDRANKRLGKLRAEKIKKILVSKGLNASKIKVISKGESEPTVPNTTDANRRLNRRVEVKILD